MKITLMAFSMSCACMRGALCVAYIICIQYSHTTFTVASTVCQFNNSISMKQQSCSSIFLILIKISIQIFLLLVFVWVYCVSQFSLLHLLLSWVHYLLLWSFPPFFGFCFTLLCFMQPSIEFILSFTVFRTNK